MAARHASSDSSSPSQSPENSAVKPQLFVAPDYGSSKCSVSYFLAILKCPNNREAPDTSKVLSLFRDLEKEDRIPKIKTLNETKSCDSWREPSTSDVYYSTETHLFMTGVDLEQERRIHKELLSPRHTFHNVKLLAVSPKNGNKYVDRIQKESEKRLEDLGKSKQDLMDFPAQHFYNKLLPKILDRMPESILKEPFEIHLAIPVPAGDHEEHNRLCEPYIKYGKPHGVRSWDQITIIQEPQARFLEFFHTPREIDLNKFKYFLAADGGGGTSDFSLFKMGSTAGEEMKPVGQSISVTNGMNIIREAYGDLVKKTIQHLSSDIDVEFAIHNAKDTFKYYFRNLEEGERIGIHLPIPDKRNSGKKHRIEIPITGIEEILRRYFQQTLKAIDSILPPEHSECLIYFCGGASQNDWLWNQLKQNYNARRISDKLARTDQGLQILRHDEYQPFAVSNGSIIAGVLGSLGRGLKQSVSARCFQGILIHAEQTDSLLHKSSSGKSPFWFTTDRDEVGKKKFAFAVDHLSVPGAPLPSTGMDFTDMVCGPERKRKVRYDEINWTNRTICAEDTLITGGKDFQWDPNAKWTFLWPTFANDDRAKHVEKRVPKGLEDLHGNRVDFQQLQWELKLPAAYRDSRTKSIWNTVKKKKITWLRHRWILQSNRKGDYRYQVEFKWDTKQGGTERFDAKTGPLDDITKIQYLTQVCFESYQSGVVWQSTSDQLQNSEFVRDGSRPQYIHGKQNQPLRLGPQAMPFGNFKPAGSNSIEETFGSEYLDPRSPPKRISQPDSERRSKRLRTRHSNTVGRNSGEQIENQENFEAREIPSSYTISPSSTMEHMLDEVRDS